MGAVQLLEFLVGGEVAEHTLVDGLEQQAGRNRVELRVVLHVLQRHLDDRFVELLRRDAVEESELKFRGDLGDPGDLFREATACLFDRQVDLVGVVRLAFSIALHDGDGHVLSSLPREPARPAF